MSKHWTVRYKKVMLEYTELRGSDTKSYRSFEVPRSTFYRWIKVFAEEGEPRTVNSRIDGLVVF